MMEACTENSFAPTAPAPIVSDSVTGNADSIGGSATTESLATPQGTVGGSVGDVGSREADGDADEELFKLAQDNKFGDIAPASSDTPTTVATQRLRDVALDATGDDDGDTLSGALL